MLHNYVREKEGGKSCQSNSTFLRNNNNRYNACSLQRIQLPMCFILSKIINVETTLYSKIFLKYYVNTLHYFSVYLLY